MGTACRRVGEPAGSDGGAAAAKPARSEAPNALPIPSASVAAAVNPGGLPPYSGPTGVIEGTVLVRGPDAPDVPNLNVHNCPAALDTYGKLFRTGPARPDGARPLADAVVVVTGYSGAFIPAQEEVKRVTIGTNCGYPERTITMTYGQRLDVANDSKTPFGPYLDNVPQVSVRIAPPEQHGDPVKIFPPMPGHYLLVDQLQPFVREEVYVLLQPLHAVTDKTGHFRIEGVPTGKLTVAAQLSALGGHAVSEVDVQPNVVQSVELALTYTPKVAAPSGPVQPVMP
ncbi:MAG: carboxypeptidase-like regulatory domain-containing protein [Polyangiaceae bacterium]